MLKKRIIATVLVQNGIVVQSKGFRSYLPVGTVVISLEFLDKWGIDEIILLDISASRKKKQVVLENLDDLTRKCFVPITYGGGLDNISIVHEAFRKGADKVAFNAAFLNNKEVIAQTVAEYGQQSVVLSLDFFEKEDGSFLYDYLNRKITTIPINESIIQAQMLGIGELMLNCVNRDGKYNGFAVETVKKLTKLNVPLILSGGGRTAEHFKEAFDLPQISALAAANMFHFVEHSVTKLKARLKNEEIRTDSLFTYHDHTFELDQRLQKLPDGVLDDLFYEKICDQTI